MPLLVQLIYNQDGGGEQDNNQSSILNWNLTEADQDTRRSAAQALHNLVYNNNDDRKVKREIRILKLLELIREYCDSLRVSISQRVPQQSEPPFCPQGTLMLPDDDDVILPATNDDYILSC